MGLPIHNEQSVPRIEREGAGVREIHLEGWTVAVEAELAGPSDGVNDPGLYIDAADAVASGIAAVTGFPDTSHVADDARCQLDPAHAIGPGLRIVEGLGLRVDRDTNRQRHACLRSRLAVPCAAGFPVACKGLDDANGYDATVHRRPLTSNCGPHAFGGSDLTGGGAAGGGDDGGAPPGWVPGAAAASGAGAAPGCWICPCCALASASMASASCTDFLNPLMALPSPSPSCGSFPAPKMINTMKRISTSSVMPMLPNIARSLVSGSGYLSFDSGAARREANRCLSRSRVWSASANRLAFS